MKIYTKTGDKGRTSLASGKRVSKSDVRLEAYGTADELNSYVGWLRSAVRGCTGTWVEATDTQLGWIQNRLFDIGAILAGADMVFAADNVSRLEGWMDEMDAVLPMLKEFVLPGGNEEVSRCHVCRCVTRRLERCMVRMVAEMMPEGETIDVKSVFGEEFLYINRLSDYFFVLSRFIAKNLEISLFVWEK